MLSALEPDVGVFTCLAVLHMSGCTQSTGVRACSERVKDYKSSNSGVFETDFDGFSLVMPSQCSVYSMTHARLHACS